MERFDFASVMTVIRKNICEEQCPNQMDFICTLFQDADIDGFLQVDLIMGRYVDG